MSEHSEKSTAPLVSVVVLSWNTLDETKACLKSIRALKYPNYEIVVVDNGSHDGSKDYLSELSDITYIDLPKNTGFTGGQIAAFQAAKGEYIALVNSDAVVASDWLDVLVAAALKTPKVGAVGGRAYTWKDGEKPYEPTNSFYSYQEVDAKKGYAATSTTGEESCEVDSISGAGVIISRAAVERVGYFDDRFFAYYEETDLFARMKRAGFHILYEPSAATWHKIGQSTKGKPYFYLYQMHRNRFLFAMKNFDRSNVRTFFWSYTVEALKAHIRLLKNKDIDDKARVRTFWWNIAHLPTTLSSRRQVQKLGVTYSGLISKRQRADDITIIIPCYNYANHLAEAIDSALNQSLPAQRIMVIDDGSTDHSLLVAKKYEPRIEVISKPNEGVVVAKNLGISMSRTTWTIFLDADDTLEPSYLEDVYTEAARQQADIVYTDMLYFGAKKGHHAAGRYNFRRLLKVNYIHNSALILTSLLQQVGGYKQVMAAGYEDWELYITLAEHGGRFGYVKKDLLNYRQHDQSSARNVEAELKTIQLHETVRQLHAASFNRHLSKWSKLRRTIRHFVRNPELFFYIFIYILLSLGRGIIGGLRIIKQDLSRQIRHHLDQKIISRRNLREKNE